MSTTMRKWEVWSWVLRGSTEIYINRGRFRPGSTKKTVRRATRRYVALGALLAPDCTGLRGKENSELYETRKSREARKNQDDSMLWDYATPTKAEKREAKIFQCLNIMPDSRKQRNKEKTSRFNVLMWLCISLAKEERRNSSPKFSISP